MKVTKLNEARFGYFKYRYGVHLIKQNGRDALLGGSNDLDDATDIAIRQADEVFSNPFMSSKEKYNYLSNMYVSNDDTEEMDVSIDFDNYVDGLMSELSSKKDFKESFEDEDDEEYDKDFFKGSDGCSYKQIAWKPVYDSDGFTADYTMYMKVDPNNENNIVSFVCVFGDSDIYRPDDGDYDFETDSYEEALEWFDDYKGFEDDLDESLNEAVKYKTCPFCHNKALVEVETDHWICDECGTDFEGYEDFYGRVIPSISSDLDESLEIKNESLLVEKQIPDYKPQKVGTAYKVFRVKNGKLYPPMVANAGGADTPVGVWLEAEEGEFAGVSKTGRKQVKSIGSGTLSYRPGWHLGDVPRASQFDRTNKETGEKEFPKDFVWAKCSYVMDVDYQPESDEQGYMRTKVDADGNVIEYKSDKYQHSLAGLHKLPKDGFYKYRTNPNPDTVPWVITGAIKVDELLDDYEVNEILKQNNIAPIHRQGGDKTLAELGLSK